MGTILGIIVVCGFFYIVFGPIVKSIAEASSASRHQNKVDEVRRLKNNYPDAYKEWFGSDYNISSLSDYELDRRLAHPAYEWASKQKTYDDKREKERLEKERKEKRLEEANKICSKYPNAYRQVLGRKPLPDKSRLLSSISAYTPIITASFAKEYLGSYSSHGTQASSKPTVYNTYSLSESEITTLLNTPESRLKTIEDEILEQKRKKQQEIDFKYSELERKYPNGLRIYKREHPNATDKEQLISVSSQVFDTYERQFQVSESYEKWYKSQVSFASSIRDLRDKHLNTWGCYYYEVSVEGKNESGKDKRYSFKIWQSFCEAFCLSLKDIYQNYPSYKEQARWVQEFRGSTLHFNTPVYDKIVSFVKDIPDGASVYLAGESSDQGWTSADEYHFGYLKNKLQAEGIRVYFGETDVSKLDAQSKHLIIVELITSNSRLKERCSSILKACSRHDINLAYVTLFKEYDEAEVIELNERKAREEEEKRRKEREEIARRKQEAMEAEERRKREEAARKEREERNRLNTLAHTQKTNAWEYRNYLTTNGIRYLYHFTDRRNLDSIRRNGGLYSWYYCENHNIDIPYPGGGEQSRSLDRWHGLQDYVRLSFCDDHPMAYRLQQDGYNLVLLRIKIDVALLEETQFSDINAADGAHHHGKTMDDLKRVDLSATQQHYVSSSSPIFKKHQAEVLVKTFIPLEYIENIDNPISM